MTTRDLADLRRALDDLDKVILHALGERARLAEDITAVKSQDGHPLRDGEREAALLAHRAAYGERLGLDPAVVRRIYHEILEDSVRRQRDWLQSPASDSPPLASPTRAPRAPTATKPRSGISASSGGRSPSRPTGRSGRPPRPCSTATRCARVLPIENSTAGSVHEVYDLLFRLNLAVVGEEVLEVRHCLLGLPGATARRA